jgi:hypothetical protein
MDAPITFEATAQDLANLAIIEATGLTRDEGGRVRSRGPRSARTRRLTSGLRPRSG